MGKQQKKEYSVFISYAKGDKQSAFEICQALEAKGVICWIAPRDVRPGKVYAAEILRGIVQSQAFLLILSGHANRSRFVSAEVERAYSKGIPVIPLRLEDVEPSENLELFIAAKQWVDVWPGPLSDHLDRMTKNLIRNFSLKVETPVSETAKPKEAEKAPKVAEKPPEKKVEKKKPAQSPSAKPPFTLSKERIAYGGGIAGVILLVMYYAYFQDSLEDSSPAMDTPVETSEPVEALPHVSTFLTLSSNSNVSFENGISTLSIEVEVKNSADFDIDLPNVNVVIKNVAGDTVFSTIHTLEQAVVAANEILHFSITVPDISADSAEVEISLMWNEEP